jgi:tetratricopeptide (TPR) repeat protein
MPERKESGVLDIIKTAAAASAAFDLRKTREAQEQQVRLMQKQTSLLREQSERDEKERKALARERQALKAEQRRQRQLAAVEKIQKEVLGIRHEHLELVENLALENSVGLREAATIFKQRLRALELDIFLPENEARLTAMFPDWKARDPAIEELLSDDEIDLDGDFDQPAIFEDFVACYQGGRKFSAYLAEKRQKAEAQVARHKVIVRNRLQPLRQQVEEVAASEARDSAKFGSLVAELSGWPLLSKRPYFIGLLLSFVAAPLLGLNAAIAKDDVRTAIFAIGAVITFLAGPIVARSQKTQMRAALARLLHGSRLTFTDLWKAVVLVSTKSEGGHPWLVKRTLEMAAARFPGALQKLPAATLELMVLELIRSRNIYGIAALRRLADFRESDGTLSAVQACVQADEPGLAAFMVGMGGNSSWRARVSGLLIGAADEDPVFRTIWEHLATGPFLEQEALAICNLVPCQATGSSVPPVPASDRVLPAAPRPEVERKPFPYAGVGFLLAVCGIAAFTVGSLVRRDRTGDQSDQSGAPPPETVSRGPARVVPGQPAQQHPALVPTTGEPCARARAVELGEPLTKAIKASDRKSTRAADTASFQEAVVSAEDAVNIDPGCAEAWSLLAYVRYRVAYDICGRGEYGSAEDAARKALSLAPEPNTHAAALRNLARIAAARLKWDEAEQLLTESQTFDRGSYEARTWLDDLRTLRNPRPEFVEAVVKVLAGDLLSEADVGGLTPAEVTGLANATLARNGRRLNNAIADWFLFCEGSPIEERPEVDMDAVRNPVKKGTADYANMEIVTAIRKRLRGGGTAPAAY